MFVTFSTHSTQAAGAGLAAGEAIAVMANSERIVVMAENFIFAVVERNCLFAKYVVTGELF
jgi:hypothetical protein